MLGGSVFGRPIIDGKTQLGYSSPAIPALHLPLPTSKNLNRNISASRINDHSVRLSASSSWTTFLVSSTLRSCLSNSSVPKHPHLSSLKLYILIQALYLHLQRHMYIVYILQERRAKRRGAWQSDLRRPTPAAVHEDGAWLGLEPHLYAFGAKKTSHCFHLSLLIDQ